MKKRSAIGVETMERLSRIAMIEAQRENLASDAEALARMLRGMEALPDLSAFPPYERVCGAFAVLRPDACEKSLPPEALLESAPRRDGDAFLLPQCLD